MDESRRSCQEKDLHVSCKINNRREDTVIVNASCPVGASAQLEAPPQQHRHKAGNKEDRACVIVHDTVPAHWRRPQETSSAENAKNVVAATSTSTAREVKPFFRDKILQQQSKHWDIFYKNNRTNFFKDRHYLGKEFGTFVREAVEARRNRENTIMMLEAPKISSSSSESENTMMLEAKMNYRENENTMMLEEAPKIASSSSRSIAAEQAPLLLELGCGVGNSILPMLEDFPELQFVACDHSKVAIDLLNEELERRERASDESGPTPHTPRTARQGPVSNEDESCSTFVLKECNIASEMPTPSTNATLSPSVSVDEQKIGLSDATQRNDHLPRVGTDHTEKQTLVQPARSSRVTTLVVDATDPLAADHLKSDLAPYFGKCDAVLLLFVLSAITPGGKQRAVADLAAKLLRPETGVLLFRDYCKDDWAELRFRDPAHKPCAMGAPSLYKRSDNTLAYFFTEAELVGDIFGPRARPQREESYNEEPLRRDEDLYRQGEDPTGLDIPFELLDSSIVCREITNRKEQKTMRRMWLQAVFRRT
ncbi:unnamed protein product [Amoebophrya sp. A25]|nr:unnamed protein product [Amoebophrya sp. A25]|eukprot:GSA25T00009644001.1